MPHADRGSHRRDRTRTAGPGASRGRPPGAGGGSGLKTLQGYLLRQVVLTLLLTVATATFVLLLGNVLKEILALMVTHRASFPMVAQALLLLIPFVLVFALPVGMLVATLLVFGRFSADQELTAARASGVSLLALVTPILLLSVVLSGVSAWFNLHLGPHCRLAYKELIFRLRIEQPTALLGSNQFIRRFPGYILYVGKVDGPRLENLVIYRMETPVDGATNAVTEGGPVALSSRVSAIINAERATVLVDPTNQVVQVEMPHAVVVTVGSWQMGSATDSVIELPFGGTGPERRQPKISEMTLQQLLEEYEEGMRVGIRPYPVVLQIHRQVAFSLACIGFTLVGIPLGIRAHRRETSAGLGIAVVLALVYYAFIILADSWEGLPERRPHWIVWFPNFLFQGLGAWLLWRANDRT